MSTRKGATSDQRVTYLPREDTTPEIELAAIAAVYGFVLGRYEQVRASAEELPTTEGGAQLAFKAK